MIKSNIPPCLCKKGPEREFRDSGTRGRPLTLRHLPGTLQEFDNNSCAAKVRIILFRFAHFFRSHRFLFRASRSKGYFTQKSRKAQKDLPAAKY